MKGKTLLATIGLAFLSAFIVTIIPDAAYAADHALGSFGPNLIEATVALVALRSKHADLLAKATAKANEIKDGMADADVRRIEGEHDALMTEADEVKRQIADAEAEEARARTPAPNDDATRQAREAGQAAERARIAELRSIARQGKIEDETLTKAIDDGTTVEAFRKIVLDLLAERSQAGAGTGARAELLRDENDTRRVAMVGAIAARLAHAGGDRNAQIPEVSRAYGEMGLAEMAAEVIGYRGMLRTVQQVHGVFERAFLTTSDFPSILMDAMNRRLLARYQTMDPTFQLFMARYTNPDFRDTNVIRAGDFPTLQPVGQAGEIKTGAFSESAEKLKVNPYAVMLNLSRQVLINDQLGAIDQVLGSAGVRVRDWENMKAFELLLSASGAGPTLLTDNKAVFHTGHGNLVTSGTVIDVTNVALGRAAMMKQTTLDGLKAGFTPVTLLCGPDKITQAEQLLTSITPATNSNAVPESLRRLKPVADAYITGNPWFLFADPAVAPCFLYGYLEGYEGPRMTSQEHFGVQGLSVKLEHDFGVAGIDYRGAYRNAGA